VTGGGRRYSSRLHRCLDGLLENGLMTMAPPPGTGARLHAKPQGWRHSIRPFRGPPRHAQLGMSAVAPRGPARAMGNGARGDAGDPPLSHRSHRCRRPCAPAMASEPHGGTGAMHCPTRAPTRTPDRRRHEAPAQFPSGGPRSSPKPLDSYARVHTIVTPRRVSYHPAGDPRESVVHERRFAAVKPGRSPAAVPR
jgi:hypothetical protein